jgi:Carbamate kinase
MGPKVEAAIRFVEGQSRRERTAVVAALDDALDALEGDAGTTVVDSGSASDD